MDIILEGDCFDVIQSIEDNSVDLVITSPPYSDICNYGKNISIKKSDEYVDWILPLFRDLERVLKPSGSFILNINDKCDNGYRSTFIYDLISRNNKETKLKLYDTYIWYKKAVIPNGSQKRFRNTTEFIFHFIKNKNELKFYMDRVLEQPKESSTDRYKYPMYNHQGTIEEGERKRKKIRFVKRITDGDQDHYKERLLPEKVRPDNVFRFRTAGGARDNTIRHPAPFHKELPLYFIKLLTDENDVVLDPFSGIGTTSIAAKELNRNSIGIELNKSYVEFSRKRIQGEELDIYIINQYNLDGTFVASFKNRSEASKATGLNELDIHRCYTRNRITVGGFIWKKEKI